MTSVTRQPQYEPFFSIIVPMFNRERVVGRCLTSILGQSFSDYEVIIVDDGSDDRSSDVVRSYGPEKLRLIHHPINLGIGPARNTGFLAARGRWLIPFDSDDEMAPNALEEIKSIIGDTPEEIKTIKFMVRYDTGELSPEPPFRDEIVNYESYIRSLDRFKRCEGQCIYRRPEAERDIWPKDRSIETLFHLDRIRSAPMRTVPRVVRIYHRDAGNQFHQVYDKDKMLALAPDMAKMINSVIDRHGAILRAQAPKFFRNLLVEGSKFHLLAGERLKASALFFKGIRARSNIRIIPYYVIGFISRDFLALSLTRIKKILSRSKS